MDKQLISRLSMQESCFLSLAKDLPGERKGRNLLYVWEIPDQVRDEGFFLLPVEKTQFSFSFLPPSTASITCSSTLNQALTIKT